MLASFMPEEEASRAVDLDQLERYLWWAAGIGWALFLLIVAGEVRGWWNDAGEVAATIVSILAGLLTVVAVLVNATKSQVRPVRRGVTDNGRRLGMIHDSSRRIERGIGELHQENQRQTQILAEIRDRL